jgi:hypothetical protein
MLLAFRAVSLVEAQLVADFLGAGGIEVRIFNQYAQSASGEIPPASAYPQVWVVDDAQFARARALIAEFVNRPTPGSRSCPRCGEDNPVNFLSCWACGADF